MWVKTSQWRDAEKFQTPDLYVYNMQVTACQASDSNRCATQNFVVHFDETPSDGGGDGGDNDSDGGSNGGDTYDCDNVVLTAPIFTTRYMTSYLYETDQRTFALPTTSKSECGTWQYTIVDKQGKEYDTSVLRIINRPPNG